LKKIILIFFEVSHNSSLKTLVEKYMGEIQHKAPPPPAPKSALSLVDPITFCRGPVTSTKRKKIIAAAGFTVKKNKKRNADDDANNPPKKQKPKKKQQDYPTARKEKCIGQEAFWDHLGRTFIDIDDDVRGSLLPTYVSITRGQVFSVISMFPLTKTLLLLLLLSKLQKKKMKN
jgi:hypothetical protein